MQQVYTAKQDCCGCGTCSLLCPVQAICMETAYDGHRYPRIDPQKCIDCSRCRSGCAFQKRKPSPAAAPLAVYALKHRSEDVLMGSTSGGAFTAFSDLILEHGGVVFGAVLNEQLQVVHTSARTKAERDAMRGSKYVQSDLNTVFPQIRSLLRQGTEVMFVGTPCQVDSLREYLRNEHTENLLLCDFVCHGVPSQQMLDDYLDYVEKKTGRKIKSHSFRDKSRGWCHEESNLYTDGKKDGVSFFSQVNKFLFYSGIAQRDSCFACRYTDLDRPGDLTIADFWGIENCIPEFYDKKGVSLVMLNTPKAVSVFDAVKHTCDYRLTTVENARMGQSHLSHPLAENPVRQAFWEEYQKNGYVSAIRKYVNCGLRGRFSHWTKRIGIYPLLFKIKEALKDGR